MKGVVVLLPMRSVLCRSIPKNVVNMRSSVLNRQPPPDLRDRAPVFAAIEASADEAAFVRVSRHASI
jgi:hypothetical protein